ncbi:MAG: type VI secretion system tube protein Hcp [Bryobacteraceae bacterium]|jgi:type VI secretion system secreted protein Hcp
MAVSFLLDMHGVPGESLDDNSAFNAKIEVDGWSFGQSQSGVMQAGTGRTAGKVSVQDFTFNKHTCMSSPKLLEACATGEHIEKATLIARRTGLTAGGLTPYLRVEFTDLIISSYHTSGSAGDSGLPAEHISFNFAKIEYQYTPQDQGKPLGTLRASYDLKTSQSG